METHDEKPLIVLKKNSWHMKMNKWVLGELAPDPSMMFNYCPYFWLTIASFMLLIPASLSKFLLYYPSLLLFKFGEFLIEKFFMGPLKREFELQKQNQEYMEKNVLGLTQDWHNGEEYLLIDRPFWISDYSFRKEICEWMDQNRGNLSRHTFTNELRAKYQPLLDKFNTKKEPIFQISRPPVFDNVKTSISNFSNNISDTVKAQAKLIKYTKRTIGIIVSLAMALGLYFILNFVGKGILWLLENWDWSIFCAILLWIGICVGMIGTIFLVGFLVNLFGKWLKKNFSLKSKNLFIMFLVYFLYYPLYYVFAVFLWSWIIEGLLYTLILKGLIIGGFLLIINWTVGFFQIFKEYFGLAYTDFCPGVKWED